MADEIETQTQAGNPDAPTAAVEADAGAPAQTEGRGPRGGRGGRGPGGRDNRGGGNRGRRDDRRGNRGGDDDGGGHALALLARVGWR